MTRLCTTPVPAAAALLLAACAMDVGLPTSGGGGNWYTPPPPIPTLHGCAPGPAVVVGDTVRQGLAAGDCSAAGNRYMDRYELVLASPTTITVDFESEVSDGALFPWGGSIYLFTSGGTLLEHAPVASSGAELRLRQRLDAGSYTIVVSSYHQQRITGAYQLAVTTPAPFLGCSVPGASYTVGQVVSAQLDDADCRNTDGRRMERFELAVDTTSVLTIDMRGEVNPYLYLFNAGGELLAWNDDGGGGWDARLVVALAPGSYSIGASHFRDLLGTYTIEAK